MFGIRGVVHAHATCWSLDLLFIVLIDEVPRCRVFGKASWLQPGVTFGRVDQQSCEWALSLLLSPQFLFSCSTELAYVLGAAFMHDIVLSLHVATLIPDGINSNI